jgi:hypothetical protein
MPAIARSGAAPMMRDPEWQNYLKLADEAGYLKTV